MDELKKIALEKNHAGVQFLKYALCGGVAFAADIITFFLVAWLLFPALTENDIFVRLFKMQVEPVADHIRIINFVISNTFAFLISNLTAYLLNVKFVFEAGKHSRWKEVGLFYLVSGISIGIGVGIGALLIEVFGLATTYSYIAKSVSATLINYVCRKYIIFRG